MNNENDYIGSGSMGYSRALPGPDRPGAPAVQTRDLWVLLESQETVGVGPDLFEEFIFPYQLSIAKRFGRIYYGCCADKPAPGERFDYDTDTRTS